MNKVSESTVNNNNSQLTKFKINNNKMYKVSVGYHNYLIWLCSLECQ